MILGIPDAPLGIAPVRYRRLARASLEALVRAYENRYATFESRNDSRMKQLRYHGTHSAAPAGRKAKSFRSLASRLLSVRATGIFLRVSA